MDVYARNNPEEFEKIRAITVYSLRFISISLFFETINAILAAALRGAGDVRFIMIATFTISGLSLVALVLGTYVWSFGYLWLWICMCGYSTTNAVVFTARVLRGGWKKSRLLESGPRRDAVATS